jgi:hypothetical protein
MKPWLVAVCLAAALPSAAESADPVVVLQETRTPIASKRKHGGVLNNVQHVVLLKNVSPYPVRGLRVTVEFYDFFGKLLLVRGGTPVPSSLGPGDTATLSVATPALEALRQTRYRFQYGGGPRLSGRPRPRRGRRDSAGRGVPNPIRPGSP